LIDFTPLKLCVVAEKKEKEDGRLGERGKRKVI